MLIKGDSIEAMRDMDAESVDSVVCDPPYGLEFMGKEWDSLSGASVIDDPASLGGYQDKGGGNAYTRSRIRYGKSPGYAEKPRFRESDKAAIHGRLPNYFQAGATMQDWHYAWAVEALRVLKPGGHLLAFGGTRTYHRLACALEDAGFEIRDCIAWMYGSGFPKSMDVSKAIDKRAGAKREVVGTQEGSGYKKANVEHGAQGRETWEWDKLSEKPVTAEASEWEGWGTALKPAFEPIVVARKPLVGTVAANVLEHGTGGLNIDGCRVGTGKDVPASPRRAEQGPAYGDLSNDPGTGGGWDPNLGRWPANVVLSHAEGCVLVGEKRVRTSMATSGESKDGQIFGYGNDRGPEARGHADADGREAVEEWECVEGCPVRLLDAQSGDRPAGGRTKGDEPSQTGESGIYGLWGRVGWEPYRDSGGASRFFYTSKPSQSERNAGLSEIEAKQFGWSGGANSALKRGEGYDLQDDSGFNRTRLRRNNHPTVKPIEVMRWLVRLVTPPGGRVLDPFVGSGTTGCACALEGFEFVGIDKDDDGGYLAIAQARIKFWAEHGERGWDVVREMDAGEARREKIKESGQIDIFEAIGGE